MTRSMPRFALPHLSDEAVAAYADGVLSSGPQSRAEHHLTECPDCAGAVREQRQARMDLRSAAAPTVPGSLLERLRQLPASAPLGGSPMPAALSIDGQPVFAAFDSRRRPAEFTFPAPGSTGFAPDLLATEPPLIAIAAAPNRWRHVPGLGMSAAAAATLIVGVLATTAMTEGSAVTPGAPAAHPVVNAPAAPADVRPFGETASILHLIPPR